MDGSWMQIVKKGGRPKSLALGVLSRVYWLNPGAGCQPERFEYFNPHPPGGMNSFELLKYKSYAPQRITIDKNNLYWAGLPTGSNGSCTTIFKAVYESEGYVAGFKDKQRFEKYVDREFKDVTGLWMCDADFEWTKKPRTCVNGHHCAGLCLASGTGSFRCVCPTGFQSHGTDGSSCKGWLRLPCQF